MLKKATPNPHKTRPAGPRGPKPIRIEPSHILDAAQRVFARDGIDRGSIRAIAREAECDPSLLYYHFENKEAVFAAILDRKFGRLIPDLERVTEAFAGSQKTGSRHTLNVHGRTPLQEALWQTLMVIRKHLKSDMGFRSMVRGNITANQGFARDGLIKHLTRAKQVISALLDSGIKSGELRNDINVDITTFFFVRFYVEMMDVLSSFSTVIVSLPPEEAVTLAEAQWFRLFWAGISNTSKAVEGKP